MGSQERGDSLREATGVRPSLHPTTVNAITDPVKSPGRSTESILFDRRWTDPRIYPIGCPPNGRKNRPGD